MLLPLSIIFLTLDYVYMSEDTFHEELLVHQLTSGHVYTQFQFSTLWNVNIFEEKLPLHFNLFPKSFAEIVSSFGIAELHLSMTQGRWRYNKWGYPILNAPPGIELWVWFHPDANKTSVDEQWHGLVHALSGQFCSSLNFINDAVTSSPNLSMKPLGVWPEKGDSGAHLRYAALSRETVCTENLTPWKKLLPCTDQAGMGSLLNALHLYDSSYHSLAIHLRSICETGDCDDVKLELKQTVSSVFDPIHANVQNNWSLRKLFGRTLNSKCPVASTSVLIVKLNDENIVTSILHPPANRNVQNDDGNFHIYDLLDTDFSKPFDVSASVKYHTKNVITPPYLLVHKYTTGYGEEVGGSTCTITNSHQRENITISYFDVVPYFVRTYLHTLRVHVDGKQVNPEALRFTPANQRERPTTIEFLLTIPPQSTASVAVEFEKVFLDWMQHPPDAHHGFYIGSSVISAVYPDTQNSTGISEQDTLLSRFEAPPNRRVFRRIYTEPLLIRVPLPDFSMPYNVICLTCTVIAIAFGSIFNLTTRTFEVIDESSQKTMKDKIKAFFFKFFKKEKIS
ncbi:GPI transamidase component PIG-T-like [Hydractinia symbiolongicarpus]|uniref:GPI transamidase component PIG-T-like n=1 Tax=Hydractinia symbiolongicarpus TaxID=13093 RepID=UPI0025514075|nr:GPI transamidase component PIG-T-like [Hydractinia symbiolongicarpus]